MGACTTDKAEVSAGLPRRGRPWSGVSSLLVRASLPVHDSLQSRVLPQNRPILPQKRPNTSLPAAPVFPGELSRC